MKANNTSTDRPVLLQRLVYSQKWVWGVVALSILVCVVIAWLHFQQQQTLNRTLKALDTFRQARIDLTNGILHLALAANPNLPFDREQGLALLQQAVISFDKAVASLEQPGLSVSPFQAEVQAFDQRLAELNSATSTAQLETELRIASDRLDAQADRLDMEIRAHLLALARQQESVFSWALGGAVILLAGICGVVFWAERNRQVAEAERRQIETGLRESEEKYRTLMESMTDGMFVAQDYHFVFANPALPAMLGYTPQAFSGLPFEAAIAPEFLPVWTEQYTQRITQSIEPLKHYEVRFLCNGGQASLWVELRANRIEYHGRPAVLGIIRDITERKRFEEALHRSERTLKLFVEYAPAAIAMFDRNMVYLAASRRFQADYRLNEPTLVGRSHYDIFPEVPERWKEIHRRCLAGATEMCAEDPFPRADGSTDWVRWEIHPWYEQDDKIGGIILFSEVITERKQAEEALRESESRFRQLAESLPQLVWTCQPDGPCDYLSQRWVEYTGFPEATQLGFGWLEQLHPDDREPTIAAWNAAVAAGSDFVTEFRIRRHDGVYRWFDTRAVRLRDAAGRTVKWFGSNTDIHTQRELREALRESEERLAFALEVSQMGSWEFNLVDHSAYRSLQHAHIFGYETLEQAWTFEIFLGHIIPEDRAEVERTIGQAIAAQNDWSIECRIRRCDGEIRWIWVVGRFRNDLAESSHKMMGGIVLDITERKQTEEKIRQSEERYRGLFEYMVEGYAYCQMIFADGVAQDWLYIAVNEAFETLTGLKGVVGKRVSEVIPGIREADPELFAIYARVALSGQPEKFEIFVQALSMWFSVSVYSPEKGYFVAVFDVITARKQAEEKLRASEAKFKAVFDNAPVGISLLNAERNLLEFNDMLAQIVRMDEARLVAGAYHARKYIREDGTEIPVSELASTRAIVERRAIRNVVNGIVLEDGGTIWTQVSAAPLGLDDPRFVVITQDITERKQAEDALRQSEARYRLIADNTDDVIWLLSLTSGKFTYVSPSVQKLRGYTPEEVLEQTMAEALTPESLAQVSESLPGRIKRFNAGDAAAQVNITEVDQPRKDGSIVPTEVVTTLLTDDQGQVTEILGISRNITERKQAEEKLRELQNMLTTAESVAGLGSWKWDLQTQKVSWSDEMFNLFGVDRENFDGDVNRVIASRIHPDDIEAVNQSNLNVLEGGQPIPLEYRIILPDGRQRHVWAEGALIHDSSGHPVALTGYVQDITARKQVEAQIQAQARRLQTLADTSRTFAEVGTDFQTVLKLAAHLIADHLNAGCVARLLSEDGQWLETAIVYDQDPAVLAVAETVIRNDTRYHIINDASNPAIRVVLTGQSLLLPAIDPEQLRPFYPPEVWAVLKPYCPRSALIVPLQVQKQVLGVFSFSRYRPEQPPFNEDDLHLVQDLAHRAALALSNARLFEQVQNELAERKRAEEQIRRTATELARSNADLEQFAYVASHDLQEPLRAVAGMLTLLQQRYQSQLDARANEFIGHAVDGATRMQTLINDLLTFSRVGTRGQPFQPVNCAEVLTTVRANLSLAIKESQASLTHDPLPVVIADRTQLIQLFQNLIANAIKFRGNNTPVIHIGAQQKHNAWVFAVSDNGIGMEGQYLERIFGVFQRLHTRREYPGTGIGLALCKKIVERHGGHIWVESEPGQGSTFYFTLLARNQ